MYRVAVCEDEQDTRERICVLCDEILSGLGTEHTVSAFPNAEELGAALDSGSRFDLLCMDILMEGKTGMDLARDLRDRDERTSILFITGSREYLKDGYSVRPIQYLYKPVDRKELEEALRADLRLHHRPDRVRLQLGGKTIVLPLDSLLYAESQNHDIVAVFPDGQQRCRLSLSELERLLPGDRFCRCHNSFLVNMSHIRQIDRRALRLDQGGQIPVGRNYYERAQAKFIQFLSAK